MKLTPPKHLTPGPWHFNQSELAARSPCISLRAFDGAYEVCELRKVKVDDAQAIAAVPDLLAALEFYANPANWREQETGIGMAPSECEDDYGSSARDALKKAGYTITE